MQAVHRSVEVACFAEGIGFDAYWVTEQHAMKAFACASPEILAAYILGQTSKIRVGVAGILVGHYASIKTAENVALLNVLGNGRFDFGIGRTPGAMPDVMLALGNEAFNPDMLDQKSYEIMAYMEEQMLLTAVPGGRGFSDYRILCGSMGGAARYAAQNGLPLVYAMFVNPAHCQEAIEYYKNYFQPSKYLAAPQVSLAVNMIIAENDEHAFELALPALNFFIRSRTDNYEGSFPTQKEAAEYNFNEKQLQMVNNILATSFIGSKSTVEDKLRTLMAQIQCDELVVLTLVEKISDQLNSYQAVHDIVRRINSENK